MSEIYFIWSKILHVSDGLSVHHHELKTVHTATGICQTDTAHCLLKEVQMPVALCTVLKRLIMDGMTARNMYNVTPNKINLRHWCI